MLPKLCETEYRGDYVVWLKFGDGIEGEVDLESELWGEMFEPLKDKTYFAQVRYSQELGTIVWPNGADFAPEFLYQKLCPTYTLNPASKSGAA